MQDMLFEDMHDALGTTGLVCLSGVLVSTPYGLWQDMRLPATSATLLQVASCQSASSGIVLCCIVPFLQARALAEKSCRHQTRRSHLQPHLLLVQAPQQLVRHAVL